MRADLRIVRASSLALAAVLALTALATPAFAGKKPWEKFEYPELGDITEPDYQRHELDNGMVIFLMPDSEWPLVEGRAVVRTGAIYEPAAKVGLASVTGDVLRTGGTEVTPADELDERLESMGAYIESGIDDHSGTVNFSFVDKTAKEGLRLVSDVLRRPAFEEEKIDIAIKGQRAFVARRNDDMFGIVGREIQKAVWGDDHPYARQTEYETIDAITRDDIEDFYQYFYAPNNVMLAVWGNFDSDEMLAQLKELFTDWERQENPLPEVPMEPTTTQSRRVLVANKDDVTQARFAVGHVGMRADDPDYYSMQVMNRILGGSFSDRLFNEVRSNLGLAYNVGSNLGSSFARPGTFQAYCGTKNGTTDQALNAVLGEIDKMRDAPVTDEELENAKEGILNSYVFNFVSKQQVLNRLVNYEYYGYPEDYLETYTDNVRAVSKADVQDVAKRRLDPDEFAIVAVGKTAEWDGDLTSYGPVEELDISIPEPAGEDFPPPTAETIEHGRAILAEAQRATGGSALGSLNSLKRSDQVSISMQGMEFAASVTTQLAWPDRMHNAISMPFGEVQQVLDGDSGWSKSPQGMEDMGADDVVSARENLLLDPNYVLGHFDEYQVQSLDGAEVEGKMTDVVLVWATEEKWMKYFFDAETHLLVKTESMEKHPMTGAVALQESFYGDYKAVSGVQFAHSTRVLHGGDKFMEFETVDVAVNPSIDDSIFAKPSS